jgi:MinD superfamily P-loop ATPase
VKEITIISGKGGTGKTTITAALATLGHRVVLCDGDVDAPDLHLILQPDIKETHIFEGNWVATIHETKCTGCGLCTEYCRFGAISLSQEGLYSIDPFKCEGCRLCERICPSRAIESQRSIQNFWHVSHTRAGIMTHAEMGPGEENSGKLVTRVRQKARELAKEHQAEFILTDGPPGTGCATIASVSGTDAVLVVMEPTVTSLHDAQRVFELVKGFRLPVFALLNKHDIHPEMTRKIELVLEGNSVPLLGKIPFDDRMVRAMVKGLSIQEFDPESIPARIIRSVWQKLAENFVTIS